jgi:eIF-2B alpha/beta/delta-like uncharacterized protein
LSEIELEKYIRDIEDDKTHGANWLSNRALQVLNRVAQSSHAENSEELMRILRGYAMRMARSRPSMAPITNKLGALITSIDVGVSLGELRESVRHRVSELIEESGKNERKLVENCREVILRHEKVMTYSYSSTVLGVLLGLAVHEVILTESRPKLEGKDLAAYLVSKGLEVTFGVDSSMWTLMKGVDAVIVGADGVLHDGSIVNKVGTCLLALASREKGIPFYAVCDTWKFNVLNYIGREVVLEEKEPDEVVTGLRGVKVKNPYFEVVPSKLINGIVTESGLMNSSDIKDRMEHMKDIVLYLV